MRLRALYVLIHSSISLILRTLTYTPMPFKGETDQTVIAVHDVKQSWHELQTQLRQGTLTLQRWEAAALPVRILLL